MAATTLRLRAKREQPPPAQPMEYADFLRAPGGCGTVAAALSWLSRSCDLIRRTGAPGQEPLLPPPY